MLWTEDILIRRRLVQRADRIEAAARADAPTPLLGKRTLSGTLIASEDFANPHGEDWIAATPNSVVDLKEAI